MVKLFLQKPHIFWQKIKNFGIILKKTYKNLKKSSFFRKIFLIFSHFL